MNWKDDIANERVAEMKAYMEVHPMDRQVAGYAIQFGFGGRLVMTEEACAEAMRWTIDEGEMNEAGELVISAVPVKRELPPLVTGTDLGKGMRDSMSH